MAVSLPKTAPSQRVTPDGMRCRDRTQLRMNDGGAIFETPREEVEVHLAQSQASSEVSEREKEISTAQ